MALSLSCRAILLVAMVSAAVVLAENAEEQAKSAEKKGEGLVGPKEGDTVLDIVDLYAMFGSGGGDDAPPPPPPPPPPRPEPTWDDIRGTVSIISPTNNETVNGTVVVVQLHVTCNTPNVDLFTQKYANVTVCLSIDESVFSCWPMWNISEYPRFASVEHGDHRIVARLSDPDDPDRLDVESQGDCNMTTVPKVEMPASSDSDRSLTQDKDGSEEDAEAKKETVLLPEVSIVYPSEGAVTHGALDVHLHLEIADNVTKFKRLFARGFMCLSLDDSPHTCWPIFEDRYFPRFAGIEPGMHRLTAEVSHPETGSVIMGTGVGTRRFWVQPKEEERSSGLALGLSRPESEFGSTALPAEASRAAEREAAAAARGTQRQPPPPVAKAMVSVQIAVDGKTHTLPVYEDDDWHVEAMHFCRKMKVEGELCITNIEKEIATLWNARTRPDLQFSSVL